MFSNLCIIFCLPRQLWANDPCYSPKENSENFSKCPCSLELRKTELFLKGNRQRNIRSAKLPFECFQTRIGKKPIDMPGVSSIFWQVMIPNGFPGQVIGANGALCNPKANWILHLKILVRPNYYSPHKK